MPGRPRRPTRLLPRPARRLHRPAWLTPAVALTLVCLLSTGARLAWLPDPCHQPCRTAADHLTIFDEAYYVNAARVIAGVRPPSGVPYALSPAGDDPNAEHPQLAKLVVAGMIEALGDNAWAWRLPSVLLGTLCLLAMYALARAAGAGEWTAVGAAALMAADNLLLVHGRIFTLDIYVLTGMLWGLVAYVRGRPLLGGALIGVASCTKMVGPCALGVIGLLELLGWAAVVGRPAWADLRARALRVGSAVLACGVVLVGLLEILDRVAPPYADAEHRLVRGGAFAHLAHMFSYAAAQVSPSGPKGIASYPWQWLYDVRWIVYLNVDPSRPAPGLYRITPPVHFLGMISPPILLAGVLGLAWAASQLWIDRGSAVLASVAHPGSWRLGRHSLPALAVAWSVATWLPFEVLSLVDSRTSYLYYMVIVMPGLYLGAVLLAERLWHVRWLAAIWVLLVVAGAVVMYPFTPWPS